MRMILPPLRQRRFVDRHLTNFFRDYKPLDFKKAISSMCRFYHLKMPKVEWYEYIDWGKTAGKTYEDGQIFLVHPENWKRGRKYKSNAGLLVIIGKDEKYSFAGLDINKL